MYIVSVIKAASQTINSSNVDFKMFLSFFSMSNSIKQCTEKYSSYIKMCPINPAGPRKMGASLKVELCTFGKMSMKCDKGLSNFYPWSLSLWKQKCIISLFQQFSGIVLFNACHHLSPANFGKQTHNGKSFDPPPSETHWWILHLCNLITLFLWNLHFAVTCFPLQSCSITYLLSVHHFWPSSA